MGLLLPEGHPLSLQPAVPVAALAGTTICWRAGAHVSPDWDTYALRFLRRFHAVPGEEHPYVRGVWELVHHVRIDEPPVLTVLDHPPVQGAVFRPLVDPVPVYPWSMIWRANAPSPGVEALHDAVDRLASDEAWLTTTGEVCILD